uniref:Uncharacterized protein n=1 Tax=Mantoniella antarctica TaxID=81844 RepID=A0A7S0S6J7_9CHLO|mmetsp:Transcript_11175/g.27281  ORF Transcript_11175/g.27281 Transcript_11175/m.27281 type:complete len:129 (+) Transcript_11175:180-566(+)
MKGEISEERTERSALITGNAQRRVSFNDKKKPALDEETNGMTDEKKAAFDEETNGMMAQSPEGLTRVERRGENAKLEFSIKGELEFSRTKLLRSALAAMKYSFDVRAVHRPGNQMLTPTTLAVRRGTG